MLKTKLLGAAVLATSLAAIPALAANTANTAGAGANSTPATGAAAPANNPAANQTANANPTTGATTTGVAPNANAVVGGNHYANVGLGGYAGSQAIIGGGNGNNNASNNGAGNGVFANGTNKNTNNNSANNNWRPSQRNNLLADNGDARAGKVIGTDVYNANDKKLGSVDDVLIGKNGVWAVVSTNEKKVAVKFDQLQFGNAQVNGDNKLVLPNETQAKLNQMPEFHYNVTNYQSVNNNGTANKG